MNITDQPRYYENYPCWIVSFTNFISILIYAIGLYIIYQLGTVWFIAYLIYIISLEIRLIKRSCVNCYYYNKFCAFGRGKLSAVFFTQGDPHKLIKDKVSWKDIIPDILIPVIPIIAGIILLISNFSWLILALIVTLAIFASAVSGFIRASLACKYCTQRQLGCPAHELFSKK